MFLPLPEILFRPLEERKQATLGERGLKIYLVSIDTFQCADSSVICYSLEFSVTEMYRFYLQSYQALLTGQERRIILSFVCIVLLHTGTVSW
jgi:hypothetical protein